MVSGINSQFLSGDKQKNLCPRRELKSIVFEENRRHYTESYSVLSLSLPRDDINQCCGYVVGSRSSCTGGPGLESRSGG